MKKDHHDDVVGPWAAEKLSSLEAYLAAYNIALKNQPFKRIYIDAFAGVPKSKVRRKKAANPEDEPSLDLDLAERDAEEFILGSPTRALNLNPGFHGHFFFDLDERRVEKLNELAAQHPNKKVVVDIGDCNNKIKKLSRALSNPKIRGIAFLDPYNPNLEWSTLVALADTQTFEVLINFPLDMAINRKLPKSGKIKEKWVSQLDKCFGSRKWFNQTYEARPDLLAGRRIEKRSDARPRLLDTYLKQLKSIFSCVAEPKLIGNTVGHPLYYLIWAGPNAKGLKIASHVLEPKPPQLI